MVEGEMAMTEVQVSATAPFTAPNALFVGDFNTGKSALINALLRRNILGATREESRALPTFIAGSAHGEASYAALSPNGGGIDLKAHEDFLLIRQDQSNLSGYTALAASLPGVPFHRLVLVDTAGTSSDSLETLEISELANQEHALMAVVTDMEYWSARHTMDFIAFHREIFGNNMLVLANKADHLNASDIQRICDRAPRRMEAYGISPAPRFLAVSARLELSRNGASDEYRRRTKRAVRDLCDSAFDALRVALYEFEAAHCEPLRPTFEQLLSAPLTASFIRTQQGAAQ